MLIAKMGFLIFLQRVLFFSQTTWSIIQLILEVIYNMGKNTISKGLHLEISNYTGLQWIIVACIYYNAILKAILNFERYLDTLNLY